MKAFSTALEAYQWAMLNAAGNCGVIILLGGGLKCRAQVYPNAVVQVSDCPLVS